MPSASSGLFGLDRKKMEEERLARLSQRKRAITGDSSEIFHGNINKKQRVALVGSPSKSQQSRSDLDTRSDKALVDIPDTISNSIPTIQYPNGIILKTFSANCPRHRDITIEEVLQPAHLQIAVISSYTWNLHWLFSKLNTKKTKLVLCMAAKSQAERDEYSDVAFEVGRGSIKCCFPPMEGETNAMHSKLMLLSYDQSLRIVVTSANIELYDWGESGVMENTVFLIDLPLSKQDQIQSEQELTLFGRELLYFARKSNMPDFVIKGLLKFDFTATKDLALVHSV